VFSRDITAEQQMRFYHVGDNQEVLLWGDSLMFSFGNAFMVSDSFRMGTTYPSTTFNSPALTHETDFVVRDFECWQIGNGI